MGAGASLDRRPKSAAEIERRHSDGAGLLAHNGSSYGNLFTGDAGRAVLTMRVAGTKKEGRAGKGYSQYFSRPANAVRTLVAPFAEIVRERRAARDQMRRGVEPRLCGSVRDADSDSEEGRTESSAWSRSARGQRKTAHASEAKPTVLASGNLGLIYLPEGDARLTMEEIDRSYPELLPGLVEHPGVGFVLVRSAAEGSLVLGASGRRNLDTGEVEGDDPLGPFGPEAIVMVTKASGYSNAADVMVNSVYDPERDEVAAFEHQVSSHGGLGGPQTHPFVLFPTDLHAPADIIEGPAALHFVLKGWLADLGQPAGRVS